MRQPNWRQCVLTGFGIALAALIAWDLYMYLRNRDTLRAKTTETRMSDLMGVLDAEEPRDLGLRHLRPLAAKYNRLDCLKDGWGRSFVIERGAQSRTSRYSIISLGREGRRGSCCKKWVASWDENVVLSGSQWLQVWNPRAVEAEMTKR
jgi:hypothetical protein